jgi:hypothetical protein
MVQSKAILEELKRLEPDFSWPASPAPFTVPEGYLEGLNGRVMQQIRDEEILDAAATPDTLQAPPEGYFASLPDTVLKQVRQETRTIRLPRPRARIPSWVAAAVIAVFVSVSGLLWLADQPGTAALDRQLAGISDSTIQLYLSNQLDQQSPAVDLEDAGDHEDVSLHVIQRLSSQEIEQYLEEDIPFSTY